MLVIYERIHDDWWGEYFTNEKTRIKREPSYLLKLGYTRCPVTSLYTGSYQRAVSTIITCTCYKFKFSSLTPGLPNQKVWGYAPATCVLANTPADFNAFQSLRATALHHTCPCSQGWAPWKTALVPQLKQSRKNINSHSSPPPLFLYDPGHPALSETI